LKRIQHILFGLITKIRSYFTPYTKTDAITAQTLKLYQNIYELPLRVFIACLIDKKYELLVIEGEYNEEQAMKAWTNLISEYSNAINPTESKLKIETILNAVNIEGRLGVIENTIELLTSCGDVVKESVYPMLFKFGYPLPRLPYSLENLAKVLKIFIGHYKLESHKYSILKNQTTDESENKDEYSWDSFQSILTTISLTMKMPPIDIQQITTGQFCTYVSQFNNYVKQQQKNAK
jgi:hypothetical protein